MLILYIVISLVAIAYIAIEFFVIKFIVSLLKLDQKYNKPKEILTLSVIEILAVLTSINNASHAPIVFAIMCIFLVIKVFGLWNTKKWVLYVYLFSNVVSWYISITSTKGKDSATLMVAGVIGSILILAFYYFLIYIPNKKEFN